ncbi:hypothetical protein P691DRAFT_786471 [Macrolepiota fuliginosa MF-IS2]|uniref:Uncharacterized protein n=1 Tax=Macrolepiota fuliginosa MF-IS2 TaxID=1400762 RepID=A0A9P5WXG8_9AGAR|nr:hypothetical protein P691DRAFT_786471 [Macrolepiota fuliginosa MF-IS2]
MRQFTLPTIELGLSISPLLVPVPAVSTTRAVGDNLFMVYYSGAQYNATPTSRNSSLPAADCPEIVITRMPPQFPQNTLVIHCPIHVYDTKSTTQGGRYARWIRIQRRYLLIDTHAHDNITHIESVPATRPMPPSSGHLRHRGDIPLRSYLVSSHACMNPGSLLDIAGLQQDDISHQGMQRSIVRWCKTQGENAGNGCNAVHLLSGCAMDGALFKGQRIIVWWSQFFSSR